MKKICLLIVFILLNLSIVLAAQESLGIFQQNKCVDLIQMCASCTYNNITSIKHPNGTLLSGSLLERNGNMSNNGVQYNLTFCNANDTGVYTVNGVGDLDAEAEVWVYDFTVTENGEPLPTAGVIVVYSILFFVIIIWWLYTLFLTMQHMQKEMTFRYVLIAFSSFLGIVLYRYFSAFFFPKEMVMDLLLSFILLSAITHVIIPIVGFFITVISSYRRFKLYGNED